MLKRCTFLLTTSLLFASAAMAAAGDNGESPEALHGIAAAVSAGRIEADIGKLAGFGTRHTLSDTRSDDRGIGAARR